MLLPDQTHWVLGDPHSRRLANYREAAQQCGLPEPCCIDWMHLIREGSNRLSEVSSGSRLRIDSFGQRQEVINGLIQHGGGCQFPRVGEILALDYQYLGLCRILRDLKHWSSHRPDVELDQDPDDIEIMFDKWATHVHLSSNETLRHCRTPTILLPVNLDDFWNALMPFIQSCGGRVFIKPRYASSASGVCHFRICRSRQQLIAPIEIDRSEGKVRLFNSLRVRSYTSLKDIQDVFRVLVPQGMIAEAAVNKARIDGDRFDLRIVVINGHADHVIARQSAWPITNLHLGNARASLSRVEQAIGQKRTNACRQLALQAADMFPSTLYCGVDILLPRTGRPLVCEVNAFGDFLPDLLASGSSVYQAILRSSQQLRSTVT